MFEDSDIDLIAGPHLPPHVYIHVPFCRSKCSYCDFVSVAGASDRLVGAVGEAIRNDVRRWGACALPGVVETVYVGGGTPTHVAEETLRILRASRRHLPLREAAEITVEANPESLSAELAERLVQMGAKRLSLGVQSFDDTVLRLLGRPHDAEQASRAAAAVAGAGMSLSIDLMCGVPGQTVTSWQETLDRTLQTGAAHVSVYPLSLEEGTPLAVAVDTGLVEEPDPDTAADMMVLAEEVLTRAGLDRYEVANYARAGHEAKHNLAYWTGRQYLGIGPAAHGMLDAATARAIGMLDSEDREPPVGRVRYHEAPELESWLFDDRVEVETLTLAEAAREDVMLGMRLVAGVAAADVSRAGLDGVLGSLVSDGLVECFGGRERRYRLTRRGWLLGNETFGRIWTGE